MRKLLTVGALVTCGGLWGLGMWSAFLPTAQADHTCVDFSTCSGSSSAAATATTAPTATSTPTPTATSTPTATPTTNPNIAYINAAQTFNGGAQQFNDTQNLVYGQFYFGDNAPAGNAGNNYLARETSQTPDSFTIGLASTSRSLVIKRTTEVQSGSDLQNGPCGTAACTYPTINLFSNDTTVTHYLALYHNSVNGVITTGVGGLILPGAIHTAGTVPAVSNTTANSCGTTAATIAGTDATGKIVVGATSGTSCTITFNVAAPTRRQCWAGDETTAVLTRFIYLTTTTGKIDGVFTAGDTLEYGCLTY